MSHNKSFNRPEDWANHVAIDMFTNGMKQFFMGIAALFVKVMASLMLDFLRIRTGTGFISLGTLFWGWMILSITALLEGFGRAEFFMLNGESSPSVNNMGLVYIHLTLFLLVGIYRVWESRRNLRSNHGTERFSQEPGLSLLWPFFRRVLKPLGLTPGNRLSREWWEITEYQFQKFIEPLMIALLGYLFIQFGYGIYGGLLIFSALSCLALFISYEDAYFEQKQQKWDATLMSGIVSEVDQPIQRSQGMIVQQTLMRTHGFEQWQEEQLEGDYFPPAEPVSDHQPRPQASH